MKNHKTVQLGIEFSASYEPDEYGDSLYLGTYSHVYRTGAIDRKAMGDYRSGELRYFVPETTFAQHLKGWEAYYKTEREARSACAKYVLKDYKRSEAFNDGQWFMYCVTVAASLDGIEFTKISVGGIENDGDADYLLETENDVIAEILGDLSEQVMLLRRAANDRLELANKLEAVAKVQK